jgi:hypothetical protein
MERSIHSLNRSAPNALLSSALDGIVCDVTVPFTLLSLCLLPRLTRDCRAQNKPISKFISEISMAVARATIHNPMYRAPFVTVWQ